ncbi:MAG: gamma carbonic anhydrase family protein [Erysipelotrichaceae bacterium]|nr:gamma carbonic anhydrase family protein [Erysipelotrichaceae bacterium]
MKIHEDTYIADNATIIGDVETEKNVNIWYGAVIRGDSGKIHIGENSVIEDNCTLHEKLNIGKNVVIGHNAIIHGCTIEDNVLIGMGSIVMNGSHIKSGTIVGAGSLVTEGKVLEANSLYMGSPVKQIREIGDIGTLKVLEGVNNYQKLAKEQLKKSKY